MNRRSVLVVGAGVAGSTLAYWLVRNGFRVTVVERSPGRRSSGSPVDVRGPAVEVADRMGITPLLLGAATDVPGLNLVDRDGKSVGRIDRRAFQGSAGDRELELPRGDLAAILADAARDDAEFRYDDTVIALRQDDNGVDVEFDRAAPGRFDLVAGADGLHSAVRRLVFGPESDFVSHLGVYVATVRLPGFVVPQRDVLMYNTPGRAVAIHPARGEPMAAFMFRSPAIAGFDHRDTEAHRRILAETYAGAGWWVGELLDQVRDTDDLYFDSVSRVRVDHWSRGRVTLVGDAASCLSLFGDGSTLAMAGAATLAEALAARPDHAAALDDYETAHRKLVAPAQRGASQATALLIPATRAGIAVRNLAARIWPVVAAVGRKAGTP